MHYSTAAAVSFIQCSRSMQPMILVCLFVHCRRIIYAYTHLFTSKLAAIIDQMESTLRAYNVLPAKAKFGEILSPTLGNTCHTYY